MLSAMEEKDAGLSRKVVDMTVDEDEKKENAWQTITNTINVTISNAVAVSYNIGFLAFPEVAVAYISPVSVGAEIIFISQDNH